MDAGPRLPIVVEKNIGIVWTDPTRIKPADAAVAKEHVLTPAAVIGTVAVTNDQEIFVIRLIGEHRNL